MTRSTILCSLTALSLFVLLVFEVSRGQLVDEFTAPQLNEDLWVIMEVGNASYEIKDGKLILSSPDVTDGIILYYKDEVIEPGFSFEVKLDSSGIVNSGYVTTMAIMTPPEMSDVYNALRLGQFRLKADAWRIRDETIQTILDGTVKGDMGVYRIDLEEDMLRFYFDGEEVAEIPKVAETRFFCISPDPYAEDYSGEIVVEYIKVSAPWVAVEAAGKLTTLWGKIKIK